MTSSHKKKNQPITREDSYMGEDSLVRLMVGSSQQQLVRTRLIAFLGLMQTSQRDINP